MGKLGISGCTAFLGASLHEAKIVSMPAEWAGIVTKSRAKARVRDHDRKSRWPSRIGTSGRWVSLSTRLSWGDHMFGFDTDRTLQELEGEIWGLSEWESSLVLRCTALRQKPLKDFTAGDLRLLIGQRISLPFLVPMALDLLLKNPYIEGDLYPGDILTSVLNIEPSWWLTCAPHLVEQFSGVIDNVEDDMIMWQKLITAFRNRRP